MILPVRRVRPSPRAILALSIARCVLRFACPLAPCASRFALPLRCAASCVSRFGIVLVLVASRCSRCSWRCPSRLCPALAFSVFPSLCLSRAASPCRSRRLPLPCRARVFLVLPRCPPCVALPVLLLWSSPACLSRLRRRPCVSVSVPVPPSACCAGAPAPCVCLRFVFVFFFSPSALLLRFCVCVLVVVGLPSPLCVRRPCLSVPACLSSRSTKKILKKLFKTLKFFFLNL